MIDLAAAKSRRSAVEEGPKLLQRMDENGRIQMDFLEVCSFGDLAQAKAMLKDGKIDTNFHHRGNGWTALHWATRRNHQEVVELLLQAGFDPKSPAKDGKTPLDLATSDTVKEMLVKPVNMSNADEPVAQAVPVNGSKPSEENDFEKRNGRENGHVRKNKNTLSRTKLLAKSFDSAITSSNATISGTHPPPAKHEVYSYGRRDSLNRTRFLLVRTSFGDGKESFKRVTFPGHGSLDTLKQTIERAMRRGKVLEVISLPDRIKIETEQQVRDLANCQKVDVIFDPAALNKGTKYDRKLSLDEAEIAHSKRAPALEKKSASIINEYLNEPAARDRNGDDIISLSDDSNSATLDDSFNRMNGSDSIPEEPQPMELPEIAMTSECLLTAESSTSTASITLQPKVIAEETVTLQTASSEEIRSEIDGLVQVPEQVVKANYELALPKTEQPVMEPIFMNGSVCDIVKSSGSPAVQRDDDAVPEKDLSNSIFQKVSRDRKFKVALFVGGIVGVGGLAYIVCRK